MGINVEFNPDLCLRNITSFQEGSREEAECIPAVLQPGLVYNFLKKGRRVYYMDENLPIPLFETKGNGNLSRPLASIHITSSTHFLKDGDVWTKGTYKVVEVFDPLDPTIHFEGYQLARKS